MYSSVENYLKLLRDRECKISLIGWGRVKLMYLIYKCIYVTFWQTFMQQTKRGNALEHPKEAANTGLWFGNNNNLC